MLNNEQNTAILIFSRTEKEEVVQKRFLPTTRKNDNGKIAHALISRTLTSVKKSKIPYFLIDSNHQYGNCFGEKLSNAISVIFNKGFENVIAVGNDCPNLSSEDILRVARNFQRNKYCIGPTNDGGVYIIGINKKSFRPETFKNLSWKSEGLFSELKDYFKSQACPVEILETKQDINSYEDLLKYILVSSKNELIEQFEEILENLHLAYTEFSVIFDYSNKTNLHLSLRGPPIAA